MNHSSLNESKGYLSASWRVDDGDHVTGLSPTSAWHGGGWLLRTSDPEKKSHHSSISHEIEGMALFLMTIGYQSAINA